METIYERKDFRLQSRRERCEFLLAVFDVFDRFVAKIGTSSGPPHFYAIFSAYWLSDFLIVGGFCCINPCQPPRSHLLEYLRDTQSDLSRYAESPMD